MSSPAAHLSCWKLQLNIHHLEKDFEVDLERASLVYKLSSTGEVSLSCLCLGWESWLDNSFIDRFTRSTDESDRLLIWHSSAIADSCLLGDETTSRSRSFLLLKHGIHRLQEDLLTYKCELVAQASFHRNLRLVWRFVGLGEH